MGASDDFYSYVNKLMLERGWTRKMLAERANISYGAMSMAFNSKGEKFAAIHAHDFAKAFGIPLQNFFPYIKGTPEYDARPDAFKRIKKSKDISDNKDLVNFYIVYSRLSDEDKILAAELICNTARDIKHRDKSNDTGDVRKTKPKPLPNYNTDPDVKLLQSGIAMYGELYGTLSEIFEQCGREAQRGALTSFGHRMAGITNALAAVGIGFERRKMTRGMMYRFYKIGGANP